MNEWLSGSVLALYYLILGILARYGVHRLALVMTLLLWTIMLSSIIPSRRIIKKGTIMASSTITVPRSVPSSEFRFSISKPIIQPPVWSLPGPRSRAARRRTIVTPFA